MLGEPPANQEDNPNFEIVHNPEFQYCNDCIVRRLAVTEAKQMGKSIGENIKEVKISCKLTQPKKFDNGTVVYAEPWVDVDYATKGSWGRFSLSNLYLCLAHPGTPQSLK